MSDTHSSVTTPSHSLTDSFSPRERKSLNRFVDLYSWIGIRFQLVIQFNVHNGTNAPATHRLDTVIVFQLANQQPPSTISFIHDHPAITIAVKCTLSWPWPWPSQIGGPCSAATFRIHPVVEREPPNLFRCVFTCLGGSLLLTVSKAFIDSIAHIA